MKRLSLLVTLLCTLNLAPCYATEAALGSNLGGLLDYAREHNPELASSRLTVDAAQQRVIPAGALPDPVLRTEFMDINRTTNTRYLLMQTVPWFGKRDAQHDAAEAQAAQADGEAASVWSGLATRIKQTYAMRYLTSSSAQLAQQTLVLLEQLEQIAQTRYAHGLGAQQDVIRAQLEITQLRGELITLQSEQHHNHVRLNALLARPANAPLAEPAQLPALPAAAKLDETALLERLRGNSPQLRIAEANLHASNKDRELTYLNRYPNFTLGIAPTQTGNTVRQWDLMVEFNIPMQQSARRAREREAEVTVAAATAQQEALRYQLESALAESVAALEAARRTEALIATRLLPQAELGYQSALAGYETGKADFALLIDAQKQILKARQQQLQAQTDAQLRLADIENLLGEPL
ncbi:MAG: TolC family protein [Gallionella sp.]|nr:TolC family protein [Gallionella sp.]